MARHTEPLGQEMLHSLGLDRSWLPSALVDALRTRMDHRFQFTLGVSTRNQERCTGSAGAHTAGEDEDFQPTDTDRQCCRMILSPGRDTWPVASPNLSGPVRYDGSLSVGINNLGSLTLRLQLTLTPRLMGIVKRGDCPGQCIDESLEVAVEVAVQGTASLSGQILSQDPPSGASGSSAATAAYGEVDLGPSFGRVSLDGNRELRPSGGGPSASSGVGSVGVSVSVQDSYPFVFVVNCQGMSLVRVTPAAPATASTSAGTGAPAASTPGATSTPATTRVPRASGCPPPDLEDMLRNVQLTQELDRLWAASNPNAPEVPAGSPGSTKRETGGWIIWNTQTREFRVDARPPGTRDSINLDPVPTLAANECVMSTFHTHPNTRSERYLPGHSPRDILMANITRFADGTRVPSLVRSHEGYFNYSPDYPD